MNYSITIGNESLPILIRKRHGARRIVIRYQPRAHAVSVTVPRYTSLQQGLRFAEDQRGWIEQQIGKKPPTVPFMDGQVIPVLGKYYTLGHVGGRGVVRIEGDYVVVPGEPEFMARRVREWLKKKVRAEIETLARVKAERLGKTFKKIALRDTTSCWGSCSKSGTLSFSWRLVFMSYEAFDYIVSHEVAHLAEHNHSAKFWKVVEQLCLDYEKSRAWIRAHAEILHAYG